jgi:hypothetical protein
MFVLQIIGSVLVVAVIALSLIAVRDVLWGKTGQSRRRRRNKR